MELLTLLMSLFYKRATYYCSSKENKLIGPRTTAANAVGSVIVSLFLKCAFVLTNAKFDTSDDPLNLNS